MKILDTYNSMAKEMFLEAEVDDDKIIKYKKEDGEQGEMKASSAKTMPKDHPAKIEYDKMTDDDSDSDTSKGQALSGGDFDRDGDGDVDKDDKQGDDVEISDSNSGPIDTDDISDMLKKDPEVMEKLGMASSRSPFEMYWDGNDLVSDKFDDQTVASIPDDANMTLGDLKKQIMDFEPEDYEDEEDDEKDESFKVINGVKYRPLKESKEEKTFAEKVKENSKRFAKRK